MRYGKEVSVTGMKVGKNLLNSFLIKISVISRCCPFILKNKIKVKNQL